MTRHRRFLLAFVVGLLVGALAQLWPVGELLAVLIGAVAFFVSYLALMWHFARALTPARLRARAAAGDEGVALILILAAAAVAISLSAIVLLLNGPGGGNAVERVIALGSVPLGWAMLHTLLAFHYAHLYYRPDEDGEGGLNFPGASEPGPGDFLYLSFTIGMTAQVSDVVATTGLMRRTILLHGAGAFFYNTVILALAVNAALTAGGHGG
jgi:uncharacterized membrane protein